MKGMNNRMRMMKRMKRMAIIDGKKKLAMAMAM
jgi:hypothetical protein